MATRSKRPSPILCAGHHKGFCFLVDAGGVEAGGRADVIVKPYPQALEQAGGDDIVLENPAEH